MAKNIFHDIIPPEKRTIRNISIPKKKKEIKDITPEEDIETSEEISLKEIPKHRHQEKIVERKSPKKGVWFLALICVSVLAISVAFLISKANVEITLKKYDISLDNDIEAIKNEGDGLQYSTISLKDTDSLEVVASGQKEVSSLASGTVVIYNNQSTSQKLIANTRIENGSGLIFRLDTTITVPARTISGGKTTPGSITVKIHADKPGEKYNVGLTDFTISAFKGDPKYNSVYARSKTTIEGGNFGTVPIVKEEDQNIAKKTIDENLTEKILVSARAQVPKDFILLPGAHSIEFKDLPSEIKGEKALLKREASITGYIFKKSELAEYFGNLKKLPIKIDETISIETKNFDISSIKEGGGKLVLHFKGDILISYILDVEKLKKDLKGNNKSEALRVLEKYGAIEKAKITTTPLWKIPENSNRINIILN